MTNRTFRSVDTHAEGYGGHDDINAFVQERVLVLTTRLV